MGGGRERQAVAQMVPHGGSLVSVGGTYASRACIRMPSDVAFCIFFLHVLEKSVAMAFDSREVQIGLCRKPSWTVFFKVHVKFNMICQNAT